LAAESLLLTGIAQRAILVSTTRYEGVTGIQNASLRWLIGELSTLFQLGSEDDVFRHPEVSYKNPGEAAGAKWK
jgi:energy-converting hydrogenase Eha subunit A